MRILTAFAVLAAAAIVNAKVYFKETFDDDTWEKQWVQSTSKTDLGNFVVSAGKFYGDKVKSRGLQTGQDARFYAISAPFAEEFDNKDKDLVLQFTTKHEQDIDCGGGYIKVLPSSLDPKAFNGDSPYYIMFGSDICGSSKKTHVIITYKGTNHLIKKTILPPHDQLSHLYTLVLKPDQTYEVLIDNKKEESGSLLEDWDLLPAKTIVDPDAKKPEDWEDETTIADPDDKKPEDWEDLPEYISDPDSAKPEDWDDEEDGEWEAPKIKNPDYKGAWAPKQIPNPKYKGPWVAPQIPNPEYVEDNNIYHFKDMGFVGFDLWQVRSGTIFDSIIVTDSVDEAKAFADETIESYREAEKTAKDKMDEEERKRLEEQAKANAANEKREEEVEEEEEEEKEAEKEKVVVEEEKAEETAAATPVETVEETAAATPVETVEETAEASPVAEEPAAATPVATEEVSDENVHDEL
ncbi:calreticulin [Cladochytrium replicatum]|nr:calreticulin [Cladochytrium replicatum]